MAVKLAEGWNGYDRGMKNHQSSLSGDEMLELAGKIVDLSKLKAAGDGVDDFWQKLSYELQSGVVWLTKGIHEIDDRPHFNICMERKFYEQTIEVFVFKSVTFEEKVSGPAIAKGVVGKTVTRQLHPYRIAGMSVIYRGIFYTFPAQYSLGTTKRDRRMSLSIGNSNKAASRDEVKASMPKVTVVAKK